MACKDCHCGPCSCIGCVKLTVDGVAPATPDGEPYDSFYTQIYNRSFTLWTKTKTTRSPFDGLASGDSGCDTAESSYPGTACVLVADACCNPGSDDPVDPPSDDPPPPPPPP